MNLMVVSNMKSIDKTRYYNNIYKKNYRSRFFNNWTSSTFRDFNIIYKNNTRITFRLRKSGYFEILEGDLTYILPNEIYEHFEKELL
jgi:hypothetical protein